MKRGGRYIGSVVVAVLLFCIAELPCCAKEVVDPCDGQTVPGAVYEGWVPKTTFSGIGEKEFPDNTGMAIPNAQGTGTVTYQVQNASSVAVELFSVNGTYAIKGAGGELSYGREALGLAEPLWISERTGKAYCETNHGKGKELMANRAWEYSFSTQETVLPEDVKRMGLNVFASSDGVHYTAIETDLQAGTRYTGSSGIMYHELYRSKPLPVGTNFVRLSVNHVRMVAGKDCKDRTVQVEQPIGLLSVKIMAADGEPAPQQQAEPNPQKPVTSGTKPSTKPQKPASSASIKEYNDSNNRWDGNTGSAKGHPGPVMTGHTTPAAQPPAAPAKGETAPVQEATALAPELLQEREATGVAPAARQSREGLSYNRTMVTAVSAAIAGASGVLLLGTLLRRPSGRDQPEQGEEKDTSQNS